MVQSVLLCHSNSDAWLSLVERCVRDAEAAGSNPVASILGRPVKSRLKAEVKHSMKGCFSYA